MTQGTKAHLAVLGEREGIVWVLRNQRIAFPAPRYASRRPELRKGDIVYLYTTRGAFRNPTRDQGRVVGRAVVTRGTEVLTEPVVLADREFPYEARIRVGALAPFGAGVPLRDYVARLECMPKPEKWFAYLRRSLVPLTEADAQLLEDLVSSVAGSRTENLGSYEAMLPKNKDQ